MKLLILSDSHKKMDYMLRAVEREQPDHIIHLGDHDRDAMRLAERCPDIPLWSVCGNCVTKVSLLFSSAWMNGVRRPVNGSWTTSRPVLSRN